MGKSNGTNGWAGKFVLGGFVAVTATLTGVFASSMVAEQTRIELKQADHGERLSRLETFNEGVREDLRKMDTTMDLILERVTK